jgi:hypothetical protein
VVQVVWDKEVDEVWPDFVARVERTSAPTTPTPTARGGAQAQGGGGGEGTASARGGSPDKAKAASSG